MEAWEPPADPEPEDEETAAEATPDRVGADTPSLEDALDDCTEFSTPPESMWDNASSSSVEFLPKLEERPFGAGIEFLPKLEEQPFSMNPNVQQVFINHVSLPHGRAYGNGPYPGIVPYYPLQHLYPQQYPPPPPYGYNPPPYQYYQAPRDYPHYLPPYNNYVNSQWGMQGKVAHPVPYSNCLPEGFPLPLIPPNHIRPSVNMVKQYSTNLREIPSPTDQMKNLSISCNPQLNKNNEISALNLSSQSSPAEKLIAHDFQQHSNLIQIKMEDLDEPKEKSQVTSYLVDDVSSEEASYEEISETEPSPPVSGLMFTLDLVHIAGNFWYNKILS